jgi:hypothetical protein
MFGNVILLAPNCFSYKCLKLFHIFLGFLEKKKLRLGVLRRSSIYKWASKIAMMYVNQSERK